MYNHPPNKNALHRFIEEMGPPAAYLIAFVISSLLNGIYLICSMLAAHFLWHTGIVAQLTNAEVAVIGLLAGLFTSLCMMIPEIFAFLGECYEDNLLFPVTMIDIFIRMALGPAEATLSVRTIRWCDEQSIKHDHCKPPATGNKVAVNTALGQLILLTMAAMFFVMLWVPSIVIRWVTALRTAPVSSDDVLNNLEKGYGFRKFKHLRSGWNDLGLASMYRNDQLRPVLKTTGCEVLVAALKKIEDTTNHDPGKAQRMFSRFLPNTNNFHDSTQKLLQEYFGVRASTAAACIYDNNAEKAAQVYLIKEKGHPSPTPLSMSPRRLPVEVASNIIAYAFGKQRFFTTYYILYDRLKQIQNKLEPETARVPNPTII